jgi:hypothetical protein
MTEAMKEAKHKSAFDGIPEMFRKKSKDVKMITSGTSEETNSMSESALSLIEHIDSSRSTIVLRKEREVKPTWHAPWELMRVISGH